MTVIFDHADRALVKNLLQENGVPVNDTAINRIFDSVELAYQQQLDYEAQHLIEWCYEEGINE
jgi:hypothetical protein